MTEAMKLSFGNFNSGGRCSACRFAFLDREKAPDWDLPNPTYKPMPGQVKFVWAVYRNVPQRVWQA
jgi:hypothetical protein